MRGAPFLWCMVRITVDQLNPWHQGKQALGYKPKARVGLLKTGQILVPVLIKQEHREGQFRPHQQAEGHAAHDKTVRCRRGNSKALQSMAADGP